MSAKTKMPTGEYTGGNVASIEKFVVPFVLATAAAGAPFLTKGIRSAGSKASEKIMSLTSKKEACSEIKGGAGKRPPKTVKSNKTSAAKLKKPSAGKSGKPPTIKPKKKGSKPPKK